MLFIHNKNEFSCFLNFSSKRAECLNNKPQYGAGRYSLPVEAAGRSYDLDRQCQMMYGPNAYTCDKESRNSVSLTLIFVIEIHIPRHLKIFK